jgi:D-3-phosphoglycerate dehydrogenase
MKRHNILILESDNYSSKAIETYKTVANIFHYAHREYTPENITAIVARLGIHLDSFFLSNFMSLKFIISPTTGLNHIDIEYCISHGIRIISLKGETTFLKTISATAELTITFILMLIRNVRSAISDVTNHHNWNRDAHIGREISSMTLGLIGYGRLGQMVANFANSLGMHTIANDPYLTTYPLPATGASLSALLTQSDIVSLHAYYDSKNIKMIGDAEFQQMKKGAFFVNTARGELIDENALLRHLESGHLAGAALDVLAEELSQHFWSKKLIDYAKRNTNLIITPHIGGCTLESMRKTELFLAEKFAQTAQSE